MAESGLYKYADPSYLDFLKTLTEDEEDEKEEEISFAVPPPVTDIPDKDQEVSPLARFSDPSYLKGRGIERPMEEEFDLEDISTERRLLYGAEQETTLTGNIIRYAQALGETLSEEGTTFTGSLRDIEDERQREIFKKFREFRGIRQQDEDAAILAGRIGVAIADPVTWVLPWAKVAKAGKIASMAMGAGVSATDEALREQLVYGEINPLTVGAATILGGAGGALGAALARNKVPAVGVQKVEELMASPTGAQAIPLNVSGTTRDVVRDYQRRFWMGISDEEFDAVEEATERVIPKSVVEDIELNNPSHTRMVDGINSLRDKVLELNKLIGVTASASKKALLRKEVDVAKKRVNEATERVYKGMKERAVGRADSTLAIQEDLSANGKLTEGITQRMVHELTRPVIGGIGGYVASGFIGDEDSSAWTWGLVGAGMAAGQYQKILQRSKLTDFEKNTARMSIEEGIINNFHRVLKVATAGTTVARLDAMGGWAKVMGNLLFNRQGSTTDSVESMINRHQREFGRDLLDTFGESAEDIHIRQAVGEVMNEFTDINSIRVGYTGIADNLKPLTEAQVSEIRRIIPLATVLQDTLRRGMDEVGVTFTRLEHYGMAQLWNKVAIGKNVGKFTDDLTHARDIQTGKIEVEGIVKPSDVFIVNRTAEDVEKFRKIGDPSSSVRYMEMFDNPRYFREEKDRVAEVVVMTPAEYIRRAAKLLNRSDKEVRRQRRFDKPYNIKMREAMEEGQQFTAPYLDYGSISQEGLNRAVVAEQLGIKNMPVVIITKVDEQDAILKSIPRPPVERYTKLPKKGGKGFQVKGFIDNIRGIKRLKTGKQRYTQNSSFEEGGKFRPLTAHFEHERKLIDVDARKFMAEEGWIDMDAFNVLTVYADKSIKTMEFARVFGAQGEFFAHAFKDVRRAFRDAGDPKLLPFEERYRKQMIDSVDAFWGKYGKTDGAYSSLGSTTMSILVFLANTNYLPRVGITSLADLVQPFQNSGVGSSAKAILSRLKPGEIPFSKQVRFKSEGAWEREYSALQTAAADPFDAVQSTIRDWNQKFFKIVQLQRVTLAARDFAYDTGVLQAHKISKDVTRAGGKISKSLREEMGSLGVTGDDLTVLGRFKTAQEAFSSTEGNVILDRIGLKAADRDALIPLVGNRLLFAQSRNPYVRSLGQFLSWAQAKTSQTNSLVARIENGDAKMAVRMLGLTTMYAGVQQLREWGKPSFDPTDRDRYMPLSTQGLKETAELSGNWLPWHINKMVRMFQPPFNQDLFANVSPSLGLIEDAWDSSRQLMNNLEEGDTEGAISNLLDVTPLGKEIKGYGKMPGVYDLYEIKDRPSRKRSRTPNAIGGVVDDVPQVPEEPDERIDKLTGRPYNEQAGGAFIDEEDRVGLAEGGYDFRSPTAIRLFINDLMGGEDTKTEEFFKEEELDVYREAVPAALARGSTELHYEDYPTQESLDEQFFSPDSVAGQFEKVLANPTYSAAKSIGEARITKDNEGNTVLQDRYNFNDAPDQFKFSSLINDVIDIGFAPMVQMRNIGKHFGSGRGEGSQININLGKLNLDEEAKLTDLQAPLLEEELNRLGYAHGGGVDEVIVTSSWEDDEKRRQQIAAERLGQTEFEAGVQIPLQRHAPEIATGGQYDTFSYIGQHAPGHGIKGGENIRMMNMPPEGVPQPKWSPDIPRGFYLGAIGYEDGPDGQRLPEGKTISEQRLDPSDYQDRVLKEWYDNYVEESAPHSAGDEPARYGDIFIGQPTGTDLQSRTDREGLPYTVWHERTHRGARLALPRAIDYLERYKGVLEKDQSSWTKEDKELYSLYQERAGGSTIEEVDRSLSILRGIDERDHPYIYALEAEHGPEKDRSFAERQTIEYMDEKDHKRYKELWDELDNIGDIGELDWEDEDWKRNREERWEIKGRARDWRADRIKEWEEAQNIVEDMLSQDESKTRLQRVRDFFFG